MDLIASHRVGLVEQYAAEAAGLAGRAGDLVQRGIVYHHLYDHSGGRHFYALLCAKGGLVLDARLARLAKTARRARWRLGRAAANALADRVAVFAGCLRAIDRERCEAMLLAYRLALAPGLGREAAEQVPEPLLTALRDDARRALFLAHLSWAEERWGLGVETALAELAWPLRAAPVAAALAALRPTLADHDQAARRGWGRTEKSVTAAASLPSGFGANPAHHYYRLQRELAERRRRGPGRWLAADESVALAA